jgi:hypothetical protein
MEKKEVNVQTFVVLLLSKVTLLKCSNSKSESNCHIRHRLKPTAETQNLFKQVEEASSF